MCYSLTMFQILKQTQGVRGSFIRLIKLGVDDYTVLVRSSDDGRLHHRYVGPDFSKAEEVFTSESERISRLVDV
ncbi:MAG: hypothetical protein NTY51_10875 [Deltaproteobacteria bacterium]|nr:hypothetical protein [Deltaproteobacteria bacterium]